MSFNALSLAKLGIGFGALAVASIALLYQTSGAGVVPSVGSSSGTSTVEALSLRIITGQADALGSSTASGVGVPVGAGAGTSAGSATVFGFAVSTSGSVGSSSGASTAQAAGIATTYVSGEFGAAGTSTASSVGAFKSSAYTTYPAFVFELPENALVLSQIIPVVAHQLGTRTYVLDKQDRVIVVQTDDEVVSLDEGSGVGAFKSSAYTTYPAFVFELLGNVPVLSQTIPVIAHQLGTRTYVLDKQDRVIVVQTDDEIVSLDESSEVVYA
jgi:hypothetical protein